jgi:hypothetical protein
MQRDLSLKRISKMADTDTIPTLTDDQVKKFMYDANSGAIPKGSIPSIVAQAPVARPMPRPASAIPAVGAAPAPAVQPTGAIPQIPTAGIPNIARPTTQASIAAGAQERGVSPDQEAIAQFGKGKTAFQAERPLVTANAGSPEFFQQKIAQQEFDKAHPLGGDVSNRPGFLGKFEHVLGRVGNIAGDVLAPKVMANIPGTELNKELQERREFRNMGTAIENQEKEAQTKNLTEAGERMPWTDMRTGATTMVTPAQWKDLQVAGTRAGATTGAADIRANASRDVADTRADAQAQAAANKPPTSEQDKQFMASAAQQLDAGTIPAADRTKLAGMQRAEKTSGLGPEIAAQIGPPPVPADYPKGTKDPAYTAANQKWGQQAEAIKNAEAGASGAARGAGFNATKPVQVLDEQGNLVYMTAGEAEKRGLAGAAEGSKTMTRQAQFNDITNASQEVRKAIASGGNLNFTPSQVAKLTLAMSEREPTVLHNEISNLANSGLNEQQQNFVTWLAQLQERALSLRGIAGMGQGTETTRQAILKALPSLTSGNQAMATKQLDAFDNMVSNLQQAVPKAKGVPARTGEKEKPAAGGEVPSFGEFVKGNH